MDVSIIIINYNTFEITSRCIRDVIEKTKTVEYEIILVDNGSTEVDPHSFLKEFPHLILLANSENVGFAKGNNIGMAKARGEFILLLNSDAFLINDAIGLTYDFLNQHTEIAVATGRLEYPNGVVQNNCQRFPSIAVLLFELFRLQKIFPKVGSKMLLGSFFSHNEIIYPDWVWGTFFMFRMSLLNKLPNHKLADDFFMYGEDMQWCIEFRKCGYQIVFLPEPRLQHLLGGSGASKVALISANQKEFLVKYYSAWERALIQWLNKLLNT